MFGHFPKSKYEIIGPDGQVRGVVDAIGSGNTITIPDPSIVIQAGDELRRSLPNGTDETFEVVDPVFHESFHSIPAHFQVAVRRKGIYPHNTGGNLNITMSGPNARINVGSTDNSTNLAGNSAVFGDLQTAIKNGVSDEAIRETLLSAVREMQKTQGTGGFVGAYQKFMALAANHMTIVAPFLPQLAALLG